MSPAISLAAHAPLCDPSGTMSSGTDDFDGSYGTPSPALSSISLSSYMPTGTGISSFLSNSGPRITPSLPFPSTIGPNPSWQDNINMSPNRQRRVSDSAASHLFGREGSSLLPMPAQYARDLGHQLIQHSADDIYALGHISGSLTRDSHSSHFLVSMNL